MGFVFKIDNNDDTLERILVRTFASQKNERVNDEKQFFKICFSKFLKKLSEEDIDNMSENFIDTWVDYEDRGKYEQNCTKCEAKTILLKQTIRETS